MNEQLSKEILSYVFYLAAVFTVFSGGVVMIFYKIVQKHFFKKNFEDCNVENRKDINNLKHNDEILMDDKHRRDLFAQWMKDNEFKRNI